MTSLPATRPVIGTNGDDILNGSIHSDVMSGRFGDDLLKGQNGNDEIWGGTGNDTLYGNSGNDKLYGSGGPDLVQVTGVEIVDEHPVSVVFEGETAGYKNTFGDYKIQDDGLITDVNILWPNASLQNSGGNLIQGESREYLDVEAGDTLGFFIISNGYSLNNGYQNLDLNVNREGENAPFLIFRDADGNPATINSDGPNLYHVAGDGTETAIRTHAYHTAAFDETANLNPDGILHTTGVLKTDVGTLTLGFEDLYNGGDRDFDDSVFTVDIGVQNALVLNAHYRQTSDNADPTPEPGIGSRVDEIVRTDNDVLVGGNGSDELHGKSGNDNLSGNNGHDDLHGGSGDDELNGNSGEDRLYGNSGNDVLRGGNHDDELNGNNGDDILFGEAGHDSMIGGTGNDQLDGGIGDDSLIGGSGDDILMGGYGEDTLKGGAGNDQLRGGNNNDNLFGGHDDDVFFGDAGNDFMHGGRGNDTVDYSAYDVDLSISLHNKRAHGTEIGTDTIKFIDNIKSGGGNDILKGTSGINIIEAGAGNDQIRSLGGSDTVTGGSGSDTFVFRTYDLSGADTITDFEIGIDLLDFSHLAGNTDDQNFLAALHGLSEDGDLTLSVDLQGNGSFKDVCTLNSVGDQNVTSLYESNCFLF
ncbi:MAG: DUF4114 domain-containing protein [Roseibium sp.]